MEITQLLGSFEQIVMLAILRLGSDAYGVTIRQEILTCTQREISPGALYTTLERLEGKGLLKSRVGDPTPLRGGRAKRLYHVSDEGKRSLVAARNAISNLMAGLTLGDDRNEQDRRFSFPAVHLLQQ